MTCQSIRLTHGLSLAAVVLVCRSLDIGASRAEASEPKLLLRPCRVAGVQEELRCGTYEVYENRQARQGRRLPLKIVVKPARSPRPDEQPVFFLSGGPGETNTEFAQFVPDSSFWQNHEIVFVDSRGTGEGHRLACRSPRSDDHLDSYLQDPFAPAIARACLRDLEQRFDLSQYSTVATIEDLDEVRQALGYKRIDLVGGSFGTYAALMYLRAHGEHVGSAYLRSLVTLENPVPLYHSQAAQWALDRLFEQCEADATCNAAYPGLREDFSVVLARVRQGPVRAWVRHPATKARTDVSLTEEAFADAVRVMMYSGEGGREVPFLIEQARGGDFNPFAEAAINSNREFYASLPLGLYNAVTCNEFVNRIRPEQIEPATRGSYAGAWRVRALMASCQEWPKTVLPAAYFEPFRSDVPALLISGDTDPVSPPRWGEVVHSFLPNSVPLIVPGGHMPDSDCTDSIADAMFRTGSTQGLDLGCVAKLRPAPFKLPAAATPAGGRPRKG